MWRKTWVPKSYFGLDINWKMFATLASVKKTRKAKPTNKRKAKANSTPRKKERKQSTCNNSTLFRKIAVSLSLSHHQLSFYFSGLLIINFSIGPKTLSFVFKLGQDMDFVPSIASALHFSPRNGFGSLWSPH